MCAPSRAGNRGPSKLRPRVGHSARVSRRLGGERDVQRRDRRRLLERAAEQLLEPREPVAQRVAVHVQRDRGRGDVEVVREVGADRLVQRRVGAQHGEDLLHLRAEPLGRDLADHERAEVEVLEAHDPRPAARPARATASSASRSEWWASAIAPTARPMPIDSGATLGERGERGAGSPRRRPARSAVSDAVALLQRGAGCGRARSAATSSCRTPARSPARRITTSRAADEKSMPKAAARAASGCRSRTCARLERLVEQRRLDRQLLVAHDLAEPRHRGEQRRRRLRGGLGQLADEARGAGWPARASGRPGRAA